MNFRVLSMLLIVMLLGQDSVFAVDRDEKREQARQAALALILSEDMAKIYEALPDSASRVEWEAKYWRMRNPKPSSIQNPLKEEFEQRFEFAYNNFRNLIAPMYIDDRGKYYIKYGEPDDFVESIGGGINRNYDDNLTIAYYTLNLYLDFVYTPGRGYEEVEDLSEAHKGPHNKKAEWAMSLYKERISLHQMYTVFQRRVRSTNDYFSLVGVMMADRNDYKMSAPPSTSTFSYSQQPLNADLRAASFRGEEGKSRLEIYYSFPLEEINFKEGIDYPLESYIDKSIILYDELYLPRQQKHERIQLVASTEDEVKSRTYINQHTEYITPGNYSVAMEFENKDSNRLAVLKAPIYVRDYSSDQLLLSDLQLSPRVIENAQARVLKPNNILVVPYVSNVVSKVNPIYLYFEIYNLLLAPEGMAEYEVEYTIKALHASSDNILNRFAKIVAFWGKERKSESVVTSFIGSGTSSFEQIYLMLDMANCPTGLTELQIKVKDMTSGQETVNRIEFELQ